MIPFTRQTLFFTATMPPEIRRITETFLHNPEKIEVSRPATTAVGVSQFQVAVGREPHEKREVLRRLLRDAKDLKNAIIFCNRKREVALLHKSLQKHGFSVGALHGDMDQSARTAGARPIPQGRNSAAGRLRRRRARPRYSRYQPRLQFRRSASCRRLRPPHRPYRPRGPRRHRDLHRHAARPEIDGGDRKADRANHSAGRRLCAPSEARRKLQRCIRSSPANIAPRRFTRRPQQAAP